MLLFVTTAFIKDMTHLLQPNEITVCPALLWIYYIFSELVFEFPKWANEEADSDGSTFGSRRPCKYTIFPVTYEGL